MYRQLLQRGGLTARPSFIWARVLEGFGVAAEDAVARVYARTVQGASAPDAAHMNILRGTTEAMATFPNGFQFSVVEATDGAQALEMVRDQGLPVEAIVSDIVMPRMNGVELMDALSASHPDLPVILMSGYATAALSEMGIASPCGIIPKPFPAERLLAEVYRCIGQRNGGTSAA